MPDRTLGPWAQARQTASWRGAPFRVRDSQIKRGRRQAVHEYPFRDDVWVEDLGRGTQVTSFRGFVVGDDCDAQLKALIAAVEAPGPGSLVHPALGPITCSVVGFVASEETDEGRLWTVEFEFVTTVARVYPAVTPNAQQGIASAAQQATSASSGAFGAAIGHVLSGVGSAVQGAFAQVQGVVAGVQATVGAAVGQVLGAVNGVAVLGNAVSGLAGNFGRFSFGARLASIPGLGSVEGALGSASAAAASVTGFAAAANGAASLVGAPLSLGGALGGALGGGLAAGVFGTPGQLPLGALDATGTPVSRYSYLGTSDGMTGAERSSRLSQDAAYLQRNPS